MLIFTSALKSQQSGSILMRRVAVVHAQKWSVAIAGYPAAHSLRTTYPQGRDSLKTQDVAIENGNIKSESCVDKTIPRAGKVGSRGVSKLALFECRVGAHSMFKYHRRPTTATRNSLPAQQEGRGKLPATQVYLLNIGLDLPSSIIRCASLSTVS